LFFSVIIVVTFHLKMLVHKLYCYNFFFILVELSLTHLYPLLPFMPIYLVVLIYLFIYSPYKLSSHLVTQLPENADIICMFY